METNNKLYILKKYFDWQILLIVFVNLFLANLMPHIFYIVVIFFLAGFTGKVITDNDNLIWLFLLFFLFAKSFWLPIMYYISERKSNNEIVQKFIYNLKNNSKFRKGFLFCIELPLLVCVLGTLLYGVLIEWDTIRPYRYLWWISYMVFFRIVFMLISMIFFDLFGSYLVLFLWWKIRGELK